MSDNTSNNAAPSTPTPQMLESADQTIARLLAENARMKKELEKHKEELKKAEEESAKKDELNISLFEDFLASYASETMTDRRSMVDSILGLQGFNPKVKDESHHRFLNRMEKEKPHLAWLWTTIRNFLRDRPVENTAIHVRQAAIVAKRLVRADALFKARPKSFPLEDHKKTIEVFSFVTGLTPEKYLELHNAGTLLPTDITLFHGADHQPPLSPAPTLSPSPPPAQAASLTQSGNTLSGNTLSGNTAKYLPAAQAVQVTVPTTKPITSNQLTYNPAYNPHIVGFGSCNGYQHQPQPSFFPNIPMAFDPHYQHVGYGFHTPGPAPYNACQQWQVQSNWQGTPEYGVAR
ncbi:hypothetical protein BJ508DRAFT_364818 [Ascobolus immersus RN42]|uniref:Uncharacterized protein n=1 Tax=Ascobolus immersus RN42 TaxID=1160509 RepID=A0A3N4HSL9_ASCIM|nr:hypothetical protein BJ508DRAFT_364818 [Ascobolus immersus RN42]